MRVWIDLANSPHPLLFEPIVERLADGGAEPLITVRDHAQTAELARERWPRAEVIGAPSPPGRLAKARGIAGRVGALARWARRARPEVALSHNSYAQLAAARAQGIPAVTAMDFEHQPANHLAFRAARRVLVPEVVPDAALRRQGAGARKLIRYPGLKEELYLGRFEPDPEILARLGIERGSGEVLAVARSAPAGATYHRDENPLFGEALRTLAAQERVRTVVLARHPDQRRAVRALGLPRCVVPERALDGRSLLREADLFVGAGGTMTREAALLGVPTLSLFAGQRPAVDRWLEDRGVLGRLERAEQLAAVAPRTAEPVPLERLRSAGRRIEGAFVEAVEAAALGR